MEWFDAGISGRKAVILSIAALLLFVLPSVSVQGQEEAPPIVACTQAFCLWDAYNTMGNMTVKICAGTSLPVRGFNIWYNGSGPFNLSSGILSAAYSNGTNYDDNLGLSNATGGGCASFVLNGSQAPYTNQTIEINATIFNNPDYASASMQCSNPYPGCNGTMFTINYAMVAARDPSGNLIPNTLVMLYNNYTKTFVSSGPAMTGSDGYYIEHCVGTVQSGACINASPAYGPNTCIVHGVPFPSEGMGGPSMQCVVNATYTLFGFEFLSSNITSSPVNATPGSPADITLDRPSAVGFVNPMSYSPVPGTPPDFLNVTLITVRDMNSGELVYNYQAAPGESASMEKVVPFFIEENKVYNLSINVSGIGFFSYALMVPSVGMTGADIQVPNSSVSQYTTFVGQVVNESDDPVANATVYVQFFKGGGAAFGISFFNSSVTDSNGKFSVRVPSTQFVSDPFGQGTFPFPVYQFYIVSGENNAGVPIYYPTVDNNNNRGYFAQGSVSVLSPLVLRAGGRVDINVTLNGASLVMSELNKIAQLGTGLVKTAVTGKMTMLSIFPNVNLPASIAVSLLSPVSDSPVFYNLFGKSQTFGDPMSGTILNTCFRGITVSQGVATQSSCTLQNPGYINLTATRYTDLFDPSLGSDTFMLSRYDFWFDNNLVLRNESGDVVLYLTPDGTFLQQILGFGGNEPNITIPVPPGNYSIEIVPAFEFSRYLGLRDANMIQINANQTANVAVNISESWNIQPMFPNSLTLSGNNDLFVSVMGKSSPLNDSQVTVTGRLLYLNKSAASQPFAFGFDPMGPGGGSFNATINPSALNIIGGKYWLMLNASATISNVTYTSTQLIPVNIFDFVVGMDMPGFSFGTGQTVTMKMFAFKSTGPVAANSTPIEVEMINENGNPANVQWTSSGISNGEGTLEVTMPNQVGFYELVVKINASGEFGVSSNWLQVSNLNIKVSTERNSYQPQDTVSVVVQVLNASSSAAITGASIEVVVDNGDTPAVGLTDSDGKATISLNPSIYSTSGQWNFGPHDLRIRISKDTGTDVIKLETHYWFDVRGMEAFIIPDKPSYQQGENVTINAFLPPNSPVQDMTAIVDGNSTIVYQGIQIDPSFWQISLGPASVGHHDVKITASDSSGNSQTFYSGFDVNSYLIDAYTDKWSYSKGEDVILSVRISYPNGSAVSGRNVAATLYKPQPPTDINVSSNSSQTGADGSAVIILNASKNGFNYIEINVDGQRQFIGLQVSSVTVQLLDSSGNPVTSYTASPGDFVNIYVNASSSGSPVPDGSMVTAKLWSFGAPEELPQNTTTGGESLISFQIDPSYPAGVYGLEVMVNTPSGEQGFASPADLTVTGGSALHINSNPDRPSYGRGDTGTLMAFLTYSNGSGVSGVNVTFEVGSEGGATRVIGTSSTDAGGKASVSFQVTSNYTDGNYFLHVYVTDSPNVQHYSGFRVSNLDVIVTSSKKEYSPGENLTLYVTVINRTSGSQLNATSGFVYIFTPKGEIKHGYDPSGKSQPYEINISIPDESDVVGSYPIKVVMLVNQSRGTGGTMIDVKNSSAVINLSLPQTITASVPFIANVSSSVSGTATLIAFSPDADSLAYENTSIQLTGGNAAELNITTINTPGVYVFKLFVSGAGGVTEIRKVSPSGTVPAVWTGTSVSANSTSFTTSQDVYVITNTANTTATVITVDESTNTTIKLSILLNQQSGSSYYGVIPASSLSQGTYFVRLDTSTASAVATSIFTVS